MSIIETRALTDTDLNEVSAGENTAPGLFQGRAGAFYFEFNGQTGDVTVSVGNIWVTNNVYHH